MAGGIMTWTAFRKRTENLTLAHFIMAGAGLMACFLILYPLVTLIQGSFQIADEWGDPIGYSLKNYARLLEPRFLTAFGNTLLISAGTCTLAGFVGVTLAWISARTNSFGGKALEPFNLIPFYISPLIGAIAWTYLASPSNGFLNQLWKTSMGTSTALFDIYSKAGIIWVMGLFYAPYMYLFTIG